jgi:hypothetical protein
MGFDQHGGFESSEEPERRLHSGSLPRHSS